MTEVLAARADGRWEAAYASQRSAVVPPDLAALFGGVDAPRGAGGHHRITSRDHVKSA